ncbi:hypothetical protein CHOED_036 [Vibrio phage CHOED]|uniref:hypothetical protein n=1 Tax=Vibrio phage CHOED TaxID=1458716 RepID=UPI00042E8A9A|nr:hypothetical protein CHOED_036 [Vibrio phage CHOED]AHK11896.1 hypothetical protein CHOED_036 [Vibrio phage CHOED]
MITDNFGKEITAGAEVFYINAKWSGKQVMTKGVVDRVTDDRVYLVGDPDRSSYSQKQWVRRTKVAVI